jgi:hypothetical protein
MYCRALIMEAARTSETSVDNYFTRQYTPENNSELYNESLDAIWIFIIIFYYYCALKLIPRTISTAVLRGLSLRFYICPSRFFPQILYSYVL